MAKFEFRGIEEYTESLQRIGGQNAVKILKYAVFPGAAVIADAVLEGKQGEQTAAEAEVAAEAEAAVEAPAAE